MQQFISLFVLAVFVEGTVEYFFSNPKVIQPWLKYVAALLGVAVAIAYNLDLISLLGISSAIPFVGYIITGIIIGRGSNYLNDFISQVRNPQAEFVELHEAQ